MVTTKQNAKEVIQKIKLGEPKHTTTESHQFTKEDSKKKEKETIKQQKTIIWHCHYLSKTM